MNVNPVSSPNSPGEHEKSLLRCPNCGNTRRFLEVNDMEAHIVDGNLNHVDLVDAWTDHYTCCECSHVIKPDEVLELRRELGEWQQLGAGAIGTYLL